MLLDEPVIHRIVGRFVIIVHRPFHTRHLLVGHQYGQDVAATGKLDVKPTRIGGCERPHRVNAGDVHEYDLAARLITQSVEKPFDGRGEVRRLLRNIFLGDDIGSCPLQRILERSNAVAAEGIILRQRRDIEILVGPKRERLRLHVHRRVARGLEDVAIGIGPGQSVGHRRLDQENSLIFGRHGKKRHGHARGRVADGDQRVVVAIGLGQERARHIRLELGVLSDDLDRPALDLHRPVGRIFEAHFETGLGLLRIGLER